MWPASVIGFTTRVVDRNVVEDRHLARLRVDLDERQVAHVPHDRIEDSEVAAVGRVRLGDEDIAVRQDVEPAGVIESRREGVDCEAGGRGGRVPSGQPFAGAMCTVGSSEMVGSGSVGCGPVSA